MPTHDPHDAPRSAQNMVNLRQFSIEPGSVSPVEMTANLCRLFRESRLSEEERRLAEDILRTLSKSIEERVRQAISDYLKDCDLLPHEIALRLARDVEAVALPILEYSEVLTDDDLIEIVRAYGEVRQIAVAQRRSLSEEVAEAIVDCGSEAPVTMLLRNGGARLGEASLENVIKLFPQSRAVVQAICERPNLPPAIMDRMTQVTADQLRYEMMTRHSASSELVGMLMRQGGEDAVIALLEDYNEIADAEALVRELHAQNRLGPSLLLRALYGGHLDFFECAISRLAQMSVVDARPLIHDRLEQMFKRLYRKAGLPAQLYSTFRAALEQSAPEVAELDAGGWDGASRRRVSSMTERRGFDRGEFEAALALSAKS